MLIFGDFKSTSHFVLPPFREAINHYTPLLQCASLLSNLLLAEKPDNQVIREPRRHLHETEPEDLFFCPWLVLQVPLSFILQQGFSWLASLPLAKCFSHLVFFFLFSRLAMRIHSILSLLTPHLGCYQKTMCSLSFLLQHCKLFEWRHFFFVCPKAKGNGYIVGLQYMPNYKLKDEKCQYTELQK